MPLTVRTVGVDGVGPVSLTVEEDGDSGQTCLLLHPGAGPEPMLGFSGMLASRGMRVLVPTHPGFNGTERPEGLATVRDLARLYAAYLDVLRIGDVVVIGNFRVGQRPRGFWLCRDVEGGPVDGLAHVTLVVLRDDEDFISRLGLGAHNVGKRRNGSVPIVESVDQVAGAGEDRVGDGLLEDIGRFYLSTYPLTAACSTAGSP
jgi:hypothetical protein